MSVVAQITRHLKQKCSGNTMSVFMNKGMFAINRTSVAPPRGNNMTGDALLYRSTVFSPPRSTLLVLLKG